MDIIDTYEIYVQCHLQEESYVFPIYTSMTLDFHIINIISKLGEYDW